MKLKKTFYKIHTWIGLQLSILFFVICFSGTLATLSHEMDWLFFPESRASVKAIKVPYNQRVKNIRESFPDGQITYWLSSKESYLCDLVQLKINNKRIFVFVNQYTGEVQGSTSLTFQRFFRDLHYFLYIPFQIGNYTVLLFGFILLISTITAFLFYKKWWKKLFKLNIGKGKIAFYKSLHKLVGSWSIPFCILFSVTGIWYFMERTNLGGIGTMANTKEPEIIPVELDDTTFSRFSYNIDYDKAIKIAKQEIVGLKVQDIVPPIKQSATIYLAGTSDVPLVRNRANQVFLHPISYEVIGVTSARKAGTIKWLNDIADPLHFGYWGGLITKFIWFIGGLSISSLVLTGIWTMLKRNKKKNMRYKPSRFWKYSNWIVIGLMFVSMYIFLFRVYSVPMKVYLIIPLVFSPFFCLGWYIFIYRMKKA